MVTHSCAHAWRVVAPWYHWRRQFDAKVARSPRETRPVFQKFDRPDFVDGFLKDPQRSLKFTDVDQVWNVSYQSPPVASGFQFGKSTTLFAPKGSQAPMKTALVPADPRRLKLFLATHRRHYAVVCEVHCEVPGLPNALSEEPCQAGFVVRRRRLQIPAVLRREAVPMTKKIMDLRARLADLDETSPLKLTYRRKRAERNRQLVESGQFDRVRREVLASLVSARGELQAWKDDRGIVAVLEGWFPADADGIGEWSVVADEPDDVTEAWTPLYRLHPNPDIPNHDAMGRAMYFGSVPTSSLETDAAGRPRFEDESIYEIRCFVRRHLAACPRTLDPPDCRGGVFWSLPTEPYRLASPIDLEGTANRPTTIQLPDLGQLAAQAANLPFGKLSPVRMVQPQTLKPAVNGMTLGGGDVGGKAICFFAIPLITIIATFVLNLFLPIVVFIFNLWFLLAFKFCIPPSVSFSAGLDAELDAIPPSVDFDVDADFDVTVNGQTVLGAKVHADLRDALATNLAATTGPDFANAQAQLDAFSMTPLLEMKTRNQDGAAALPASEDGTTGLDLTGSIAFEERVAAPLEVA
jgi:hypothetical protein